MNTPDGKNRTQIFRYLLVILILFSFLTSAAPAEVSYPYNEIRLSSFEEIEQDLKLAPCKDEERLDAVRKLFEKMGARSEDISIQNIDKVENLVVEKRGQSQEIIVIGAHYDKTREGCGAVDNWTGVVTVAHLYRSFKNASPKKNLIFVAFGKEEIGLLGSGAMVKRIPKEQIPLYCAMINIDSLGMGKPQVATNISSRKLEERTAALARNIEIPFARGPIPSGADSDSSSFLSKKIPALTIHGLTNDYANIIHTYNDKPEKINTTSVYLGYRLALALAFDLANVPCDASR